MFLVNLHFDIARGRLHHPLQNTLHAGAACHECFFLVNLTAACVPAIHRAAFNLRSFLHKSVFILLFIEGNNVFLHFDIAQVKNASRGMRLSRMLLWRISVACVPGRHQAAFNLSSFLYECVFILLFTESHFVLLHADIVLLKANFTRETLVTNASLLNLTVACVPLKHRAAFNLRSFLQESVFILFFIEGNNNVLHFDITQIKKRFTREPLVTNVSLVNLTCGMCP